MAGVMRTSSGKRIAPQCFETGRNEMRNFSVACGLVLAVILLVSCHSADPGTITVYKTPTCGCCGKWIEHLEAGGFAVEAIDVENVGQIKKKNGVPAELASCHTALVDGYVIEGHVPAEDVKRLLEERPEIAGLAVPAMPIGSPGMEGPNPEPYEVIAFTEEGSAHTYASHGP
jgi:hypothetical protein